MNIRIFTGFMIFWISTASLIFTGFVILDILNQAEVPARRIVAIAIVSLTVATPLVLAYISGVGDK